MKPISHSDIRVLKTFTSDPGAIDPCMEYRFELINDYVMERWASWRMPMGSPERPSMEIIEEVIARFEKDRIRNE